MISKEQDRVVVDVAESELAQKLLDTPLRKVYTSIISMIGADIWDQKFVAKLLDGFEQCLKALDTDYETIDLMTLYYRMKLEGPTFKESCRFGGFCTDKKLYEGCINEPRMKNNWMCWRDGILLREEGPWEVKPPLRRDGGLKLDNPEEAEG